MSIKTGAYLGGIRTLEELRMRCVCKDDCWHLRKADGRKLQQGARHSVHLHGIGGVTAGRAAWMLAGKPFATGRTMVIYRACDSYDCVNPDHLRQGKRGAVAQQSAKAGKFRSASQVAPLTESRLRRTKMTPELVGWMLDSEQGTPDLAHAFGMSTGRINAIKRKHARRPASVFQLAQVAAPIRRAA